MSATRKNRAGGVTLADLSEYAGHDWPIFPVKPRGKEPLTPDGFKSATTDPAQIVKWLETWPKANWACVPGQTGHVVIDIDGQDGEKAAQALGLLSKPTLTVLTARGRHLWFKHPGGTIGNAPLAPHLDVRGDHGYVLLPPSIHPSGKRYRWVGKVTEALPPPPAVLAKLTNGDGQKVAAAPPLPERIPEGKRNQVFTSAAGTMRRRGMSEAAILAALTEENVRCVPPLAADELAAIAKSMTRYQPAAAPAIVSPPTQPMRVARELVQARFQDSAGLVLRDWRGDFYRYDGTCWPELEGRLVRAETYTWLEKAHYEKKEKDGTTTAVPWDPTRHKITDVIDALRAVVVLDGEPPLWTDGAIAPAAGAIVSMKNGLLHVPTRTLHPHTARFFTHHALPFDFDPRAPAPHQWLAFLAQLWPDDDSAIDALQEVFGYVLGGDTRQQKIILLVGPRRGGKGTIGRVLTGLFGAHNVAAPTMAGLATNFGLQPLIGRPLGLISDARLSGRADSKVVVERLLSISGEDSLTIDRKYKDPWTGRLPTRFVILTNELPRLTDSSGALASRFIVFVLTKSFLGREDPGLTDRLLGEAPGIFNWALEGLDRLNARGFFEPPVSGREAVQQLEDLASPISAFVREYCTLGPDEHVEVDDLWSAWKEWCVTDNRGPGIKAVFGRDLRAAVATLHKARPRDDGDRKMVYEGIGLNATGITMLGHCDHRDQAASGHSGHGDRAMYPPRGRGDAWEPGP
jgi:putative DNA primase/helicase